MIIDIICSDAAHPVNLWLKDWVQQHSQDHTVSLHRNTRSLTGGDILFLVSCTELISAQERKRYRETMILHASNLPIGRGWSPHVWAILDGGTELTITLLRCEDAVDSGAIWAQEKIRIPKTALFDEINTTIFMAEMSLMSNGVQLVGANKQPRPQPDISPTYYPRRTPEDSNLDPECTLASLFDQIRVADPQRYPAYFALHGQTYSLEIRKKNYEKTDD